MTKARPRPMRALLGLLVPLALRSVPAAADPRADALWFDPTKLELQESFAYLAAANSQTSAPQTTSGHVITAETEIAYNATDWYRVAVAVPISISAGTGNGPSFAGETFETSGVLLRNQFITPRRADQMFYFGANVQLAYTAPGAAFAALGTPNTRFAAGLTPIVGFHYANYDLLLSPTLVLGLGSGATTNVVPAARLTRAITETFDVGVEYNGSLGPVGSLLQPGQQAHIFYGVTDFSLGGYNLGVGVGYDFAGASSGLAAKLSVGRRF